MSRHVGDFGEAAAESTAKHGPVVQLARKADARDRRCSCRWDDYLPATVRGRIFSEGIQSQVVAYPEVERCLLGDLPVVLEPAGEHVPIDGEIEIAETDLSIA